jgi:hypothetical protein
MKRTLLPDERYENELPVRRGDSAPSDASMNPRYGALVPLAVAAGIACAPMAPADMPGLGPFVGEWGAHGERLTVNADGTGTETYRGGSMNFRISSVQPPPPQPDHIAYGNIISGGNAPTGSYVTITLVDGGQGALLSVAGADNSFPFCKMVNGTYANSADCGA